MGKNSKPGRKPRVSDDEILQVLRDTTDPVLATSEVTEQLPIKRSATYKRLAALSEEGAVSGKQIGGRNTVWWIEDNASSDATNE